MAKGLRCPHCHKNVHFGKQMQEWDDDYGGNVPSDDPETAWAFVTIWCRKCKQYAYIVDITGVFTEEENVSEQVKKALPDAKTIAFPKTKKPKN